MEPLRVGEFEEAKLNPEKQFLPDFVICNDRYVHTPRTPNNDDIGLKGKELFDLIRGIPGVTDVTISKKELRVSKEYSHTWEEITPMIREAFKHVYGPNIKFVTENGAVIAWRRLKTQLKA